MAVNQMTKYLTYAGKPSTTVSTQVFWDFFTVLMSCTGGNIFQMYESYLYDNISSFVVIYITMGCLEENKWIQYTSYMCSYVVKKKMKKITEII